MNKADECNRIIDYLQNRQHAAHTSSPLLTVATVEQEYLAAAIALLNHLSFLNKAESEGRLHLTPFARGQRIWIIEDDELTECVVDSCDIYKKTFQFHSLGKNQAASWAYSTANTRAFANKAAAEYHLKVK